MKEIWDNRYRADGYAYGTYLLAGVAAALAWWRRKTMFRRAGGLTYVVGEKIYLRQ